MRAQITFYTIVQYQKTKINIEFDFFAYSMAKIVVFGRFVRQNWRVSGFERILKNAMKKIYKISKKVFKNVLTI